MWCFFFAKRSIEAAKLSNGNHFQMHWHFGGILEILDKYCPISLQDDLHFGIKKRSQEVSWLVVMQVWRFLIIVSTSHFQIYLCCKLCYHLCCCYIFLIKIWKWYNFHYLCFEKNTKLKKKTSDKKLINYS